MTQELYQKAMKFAGEKHAFQKVTGTESNYLLHLSNVAMEILIAYAYKSNFNIDLALPIAVLHDTLEDTNATLEELKTEFGERVANGVSALTKNEALLSKQERMIDSLERVNRLEKEVGMVKLADRITNLQVPPKHWSKEKIQAYWQEAMVIDELLPNKNEYLNNRLKEKIKAYEVYCK